MRKRLDPVTDILSGMKSSWTLKLKKLALSVFVISSKIRFWSLQLARKISPL